MLHTGAYMQVLAQLADEEDILTHTLDMGQVDVRRANMPLAAQRRHDLYKFIDCGQQKKGEE